MLTLPTLAKVMNIHGAHKIKSAYSGGKNKVIIDFLL